ncbi:MAG: PEP-CTERM sorting domain-containing protein [Verrucomicrobiales bacterium]
MKKFFTSVSVATVIFAGVPGQAAILLDEPFDYADGSLTTVSPDWSTHSGTAGQIQVSSGMVTLTDSDSEDANRQMGISLTTGVIYAGFDFSVTAPAPAGGSDFEYFAHFGNGSTDFTSRMDVTAAVGAGDFTTGIAGGSSTAQATWPTDLTFDTNYRALIRYNRDNGISTLWISPADESDPSIDSLEDFNDVSGFYFRQSNSGVNETIMIDNLVVATTFTEALTGIPEPSAAILLFLSSLLTLRRRR